MSPGLMYFSTRSYDVCHVAIVAFVPVIMSYNGIPISRLTAVWSGLFLKYLVVTLLMRWARSFVYARLVRFSWNVSFQICHLFNAKNIIRWHKLVAHVCAD